MRTTEAGLQTAGVLPRLQSPSFAGKQRELGPKGLGRVQGVSQRERRLFIAVLRHAEHVRDSLLQQHKEPQRLQRNNGERVH